MEPRHSGHSRPHPPQQHQQQPGASSHSDRRAPPPPPPRPAPPVFLPHAQDPALQRPVPVSFGPTNNPTTRAPAPAAAASAASGAARGMELDADAFPSDAPYLRQAGDERATAGSSNTPYRNLRTPMERHRAPGATMPQEAMRRLNPDDSSEDSFDDGGSQRPDRMDDAPGDLGWFHATVKVQQAIQWRNNVKIQSMMFLLFVVGAITTVMLADNERKVSVGLICGSVLTLLSCCSVMYTFLARKTWKKHPNPLVFFRSLCDVGLVLVLLIPQLYKCYENECGQQLTASSCRTSAGLTQFFLWSSESWFCVMAVDMFYSLKSPFTDYKSNMKRYHTFVWTTAVFTSVLLVAIPGYAGQSDFGFCWTHSESISNMTISNSSSSGSHDFFDIGSLDTQKTGTLWKFNTASWVLFYTWLALCWLYAVLVIRLAWKRFSSGVSETLRLRLRVLHSVTLYVVAIIIYWCLTFAVYIPYLIKTENQSRQLVQLLNFMITCKGYFDFVVWFQMNEVSELSSSTGGKKSEMDVDVDLSPQVNLALRCEVLYYTTTGIIQAVKDTAKLPPNATQQELYLPPQGTEDNRGSLGVDEYMIRNKPKAALEKGTLFTDYHPHTFQTIREHFGVDSTQYIESLTRTTKERLSEGASGAFMFFSLDQQLIVKSMSNEESAFLRSIASDYCAYLLTNPDSLLTRFYGCHAIRLYGNTFNFVVMANLFSTDNVIHRRYDIKGSWVNRSASHPSKGKRVTCRHCNAKFVFGSGDLCRERVGIHEPNVVLKDNDLTAKVRLNPQIAGELYAQLVKDANFLANRGIMDYSLLLGVHNVEYTVNTDEDDPLPTTLKNREQSDLRRRPGRGPYPSDDAAVQSPQGEEQQGLPRLATGTRRANRVVGPSIYYFGVIDILQQWNMNKRLERFTKTKLLGKDADGLSAVPPMAYCHRFKRKMAEVLSISASDDGLEHSTGQYYPQAAPADASQQRFI